MYEEWTAMIFLSGYYDLDKKPTYHTCTVIESWYLKHRPVQQKTILFVKERDRKWYALYIEGKDTMLLIVPPKVSITNNMCAFHKAIRIILCAFHIFKMLRQQIMSSVLCPVTKYQMKDFFIWMSTNGLILLQLMARILTFYFILFYLISTTTTTSSSTHRQMFLCIHLAWSLLCEEACATRLISDSNGWSKPYSPTTHTLSHTLNAHTRHWTPWVCTICCDLTVGLRVWNIYCIYIFIYKAVKPVGHRSGGYGH